MLKFYIPVASCKRKDFFVILADMTPIQFFQGNVSLLLHDFIGIRLYPQNIADFSLSFLFAVVLIFILFRFGEKIKRIFFKTPFKHPLEDIFLSLAFGHIIFATGIFLLGVVSFLTPVFLSVYLVIITVISLFPFVDLPKKITELFRTIGMFCRDIYKTNPLLVIGILLFVAIGILKLLSPEIGVDAIFYHHDYPKEYLRIHSLMEYPRGSLIFLTTPQLGQMLYVVVEFFGLSYGIRMIHFLFFFLDLLLLAFIGSQKKAGKFSALPALLFAASPTVIGVFASGYVDAEWIFLWLLSFWIFTRESLSFKTLLLSALLFGGVMASKIQGFPFILAFLGYIFFKTPWKYKIKYIATFAVISMIFPSLWYIRSYLLTGNIFFPVTFDFSREAVLTNYFTLISLQQKLYSFFPDFNPFILIGAIASFVYYLTRKNKIKIPGALLFVFLIAFTYTLLPVPYYSGRFLLFSYSILATLAADPTVPFFKKKLVVLGATGITLLLFVYYVSNALLIFPYGLGWANTNAYLTRVLARDNASYYDFNRQFSPFISKHDYIGTYTVEGFFYANFSHRDVEYVIKPGDNFDTLKQSGFTKLLIKHGDIQWFCDEWKLTACTPDKYTFLTSYDPATQYLYTLK